MAGFTMTLRFKGEDAPPRLRIALRDGRADVRKVMGRAMATKLRKHFSTLDRQRPNKLGGTRTHFWGEVRRSVQQPELVGGDGVKVSIDHVGIAHQYFGGEIRAKNAGKLTIPAHPAAHGHRAREFDLHPIYFENGDGILVKDNTESKTGIGEVYYRLVDKVVKKKDPSVLPTDQDLQDAAFTAGEEHMQNISDRS